MITRLEATRYRCFEQLGVDMSAFQVIVGANGSGKTTLIDLPSLFGELLRADNIASVFTLKRGNLPARAAALRELVFAGRGDDFSLALEVELPEDLRHAWADALLANIKSKRQQEVFRNSPAKWPGHLRYELRLEVFNERELNVKNEYLFAYPPAAAPDRSVGGLLGEANQDREDWHFMLRREYGGPAVFVDEAKTGLRDADREDKVRIKPGLLAMSAVKYKPDAFPAAGWLYELLTEKVVFLAPEWEQLRAASATGQEKTLIASALNLPWLALNLKRQGLPDEATAEEQKSYRSRDFNDWVDHVKTALPQVEDIDIKEREEDHRAYFSLRYSGGYSVTSSGLSDGTLRILTLTLLAYLPDAPRLVVTEEPENGIHPSAIEAILQSLESLYGSQVWISSHSPVVLAASKLEQLLCARQTPENGVVVVAGEAHPRLRDWRGGIDLGSLFAAGILG
ncbi:ATPase [Rubrivivax sp. A210]|uniref:methylation-associated defense system AAA family ATPase MAD3 n=1 Tax=Rubrivivax sp. A210 TaxID=2772301 RepID=UPI00191AEF9E|nr:AAA family ATPase [Rubrivivax sp. A210]CAD5370105.1 ATPase [Rubrivivax sp. A210]